MNDNLRENAERGVFSGKLGYVLATAGSGDSPIWQPDTAEASSFWFTLFWL